MRSRWTFSKVKAQEWRTPFSALAYHFRKKEWGTWQSLQATVLWLETRQAA
jgi:hypothetical protein